MLTQTAFQEVPEVTDSGLKIVDITSDSGKKKGGRKKKADKKDDTPSEPGVAL
jgi:hypothetical protein